MYLSSQLVDQSTRQLNKRFPRMSPRQLTIENLQNGQTSDEFLSLKTSSTRVPTNTTLPYQLELPVETEGSEWGVHGVKNGSTGQLTNRGRLSLNRLLCSRE